MIMKSIISIIVPIYNAEKFIERCIKSVLNQTEHSWELILINDGSIDNTEQICKKYVGDARIHLYSKRNTGVSDTRNIGIEKAIGNWITFLDADDELSSDYIENALKIISKNNYDIIVGQLNTYLGAEYLIKSDIEYNRKNKIRLMKNLISGEKKENYNSSLLGFVIGKIYKSEIVKNLKFPLKIRYREDTLFNLQAFLKAKNILVTNSINYHYIINTQSACFKYIPDYMNEIKQFNEILENIIESNNLDLKEEFYICMTNMYMVWLKLCIIHDKSNLTKKEKKIKIKESFYDKFWTKIFQNVKFKRLTKQYKVLYTLYKLKLSSLIYMIACINKYKNQKKYK